MFRVAVGVLVGVFALSCGGGNPVKVGDAVPTLLKGVVVKGPVKGATVKVFRTGDDFVRGEELATATTDEAGAFEARLKPFNGAVLVVATDGTYVEEALGFEVGLSSNELATYVADVRAGATSDNIRLTPVSTLGVAFTRFHVGRGQSVKTAWEEARTNLNAHLGTLDWASVSPADLTKSTSLSQEGRAAVLLAALSSQAKLLAVASNVSPGLAINAGSLTAALVKDAEADGTLNGRGADGPITLGTQRLDGQTLRLGLSQGLIDFVKSAKNGSGLTEADIRALATRLATSDNAYLFCPDQDSLKCSAGPTDIDAPVISFLAPTEGAAARGAIAISVRAVDATEVKSLVFEAPMQLVSLPAELAGDKKTATLMGTFDVSALPDGDVVLRVKAVDSLNNESVKSITIKVSNRGPVVSINAPSVAQVVRGTISVVAAATAQSGTVARLEAVGMVPGLEMDTKPEAAAFEARWDTTRVPEGDYTINLRATDSNGGIGDGTVTVRVDNVPLGTVDVSVSAGAPLAGASVSLVAIDPATGLPPATMPNGGLLGRGAMPTDMNGHVAFTLTEENYSGPVQLVAEGTNLTVADPSDLAPALDGGAALQVAMPGTLKLTSYVANYRTGDALSGVVTLYTTIADSAVRAWALGRNPTSTTAQSLPGAMATVDGFLTAHISRPTTWQLRAVRPASLVGGQAQSLRDTVYAALPDVALHQLARELSAQGALTPGTAVTAFTLTDLLIRDVSDGLFDGQAGGMALATPGTPSYSFDANTTRFKLASSLDRFIRGARNTSTLTRPDVQAAGVFDNLCNSAPPSNPLYPAATPPIPFDSAPPSVSFVVTFSNGALVDSPPIAVGANQVVAGTVKVVATAADDSGMRSLIIRQNGTPLTELVGNTPERWAGTHAPTTNAVVTYTAAACDSLNNCTTADVSVLADVASPVITVTQPSGQRVRTSVPVDASATDSAGVASLIVSAGLSGFSDTDASVGRVQGSWTLPMVLVDGPISVTFRSCDVVGNCGTSTGSVIIDRTPPVITTTVTYLNTGMMTPAAPLVRELALGEFYNFVAGTIAVVANATDAAGVASTTVTRMGMPLMPIAGNTVSRYQGSYVTTSQADGMLQLVSRACDTVGNCADSNVDLVVDNTPPTITVQSPASPSPFYSVAVPVEATASDVGFLIGTAGVTSLALNGWSGFVDQDAAPERVFGSWSIVSAQADGQATSSLVACDGVGNCTPSRMVAANIDRTPPQVTITTAPPQFTNASTSTAIPIAAAVTDGSGSGVAQTFLTVSPSASSAAVPGTRGGAFMGCSGWPACGSVSWQPRFDTSSDGPRSLTIYAVDNAVPPNSGQGRAAPFVASATSFVDRTPPQPLVEVFPAVIDEANLTFQRSPANGPPVMPVSYVYASPARIDLSPGPAGNPPVPTTVNKSPTRLSWGPTTPTGAELEGANPFNVPFQRVRVPFVAASDSPIATASFTVTARFASGSDQTFASMPAIASPTANSFVLPFAKENVPLLAQAWPAGAGGAPPTAIVRANITVTDAAGNVGTYSPPEVRIQMSTPPIAVVRDSAYASRGDAKSIYQYRLSNQTYAQMFDPTNSNFQADDFLRHGRFIIYNPASEPVALRFDFLSGTGQASTDEVWDARDYRIPGNDLDLNWVDNFGFRLGNQWDDRGTFAAQCGFDPQFQFPCAPGGTQVPVHITGQTSVAVTCRDYWTVPGFSSPVGTTYNSLRANPNSRANLVRVFKNAVTGPTGFEATPADVIADATYSQVVLPAATGTTAGTTAVYLGGRRFVVAGRSARPLNYGPNPYDATSRYQFWFADFWRYDGRSGYTCAPQYPDTATAWHRMWRWYDQLASASTNVIGGTSVGLTISAAGALQSGSTWTAFGAFTVAATPSYSLSFNH